MPNEAENNAPDKFFNQAASTSYDERNQHLSKISECLHFLSNLTLSNAPEEAKVLCVGVGTGAEILAFAKMRPHWRFVGVDPSEAMLDVCRAKLDALGLTDRCTLVHGYAGDVEETQFDVSISFFVAHFIPKAARSDFYRAIIDRLKPNGRFVSAEISYDLDSDTFPDMLKNWSEVQRLMGATPETLSKLPSVLQDQLSVLSDTETERLMLEAGFSRPVKFFQAFMINGWHTEKPNSDL